MNQDELRKAVFRHQKLAAKHTQAKYALLELCECVELTSKKDYTPGGYLNTGYYEYWDECTLCRKRHNVRTESDGMFG